MMGNSKAALCACRLTRERRAIDLIRGYIRIAEAQAQGAALTIPLLSLELAVRELSADQTSIMENRL